MDHSEYLRLVELKKAAASTFDAGKRRIRTRIASALLMDPEKAVRIAFENLENKRAPWQQWSRTAWADLLRTKAPEDLAAILTHPASAQEEELSDSHPFAGVTVAA